MTNPSAVVCTGSYRTHSSLPPHKPTCSALWFSDERMSLLTNPNPLPFNSSKLCYLNINKPYNLGAWTRNVNILRYGWKYGWNHGSFLHPWQPCLRELRFFFILLKTEYNTPCYRIYCTQTLRYFLGVACSEGEREDRQDAGWGCKGGMGRGGGREEGKEGVRLP